MRATQTQAQIYLADQRGCSQVDYFRSFHSFNFGSYVDESRKPFGALQLLNDDTLAAGRSIRMQVDVNTIVILLPVVGGLDYKSPVGNGCLEAGQTQILSLASGMAYEISNPYETELVNFIQLWLADSQADFTPKNEQLTFDLRDKNKLLPLFVENTKKPTNQSPFRGFIGNYEGRKDDVYPLKTVETTLPPTGIYVFILSGAFEVQNRLLHARDGLALTDIRNEVIEFEALSNDAILLLMEIPFN